MLEYRLFDLAVHIDNCSFSQCESLETLLECLGGMKSDCFEESAKIQIFVANCLTTINLPSDARSVFKVDGLEGLESGDFFYVTDGDSVLKLESSTGIIEAYLNRSFLSKSSLTRSSFWAYGLMKLLRKHGFFPLHAAGVVSPDNIGMLMSAPSGCGKSTLSIGLLNRNWRYLTDDAVLLHAVGDDIEAHSMRRQFFVDYADKDRYDHQQLTQVNSDSDGLHRYRVDMDRAFPNQFVECSKPRLLLFPQIVTGAKTSRIELLNAFDALGILLAESGPQLFNCCEMHRHLNVLRKLIKQCTVYRLLAAQDLYQEPGRLSEILRSDTEG